MIHAGTPAKYVPDLMKQLFAWLKQSKYHPLVKSCVFHYEFEFIHPFAEISETHSKTNVVINEEKIIALLRRDGSMSANMLSVSVGVTGRQAQRILAKLKAEGKIIRHGANKNGYWEVID